MQVAVAVVVRFFSIIGIIVVYWGGIAATVRLCVCLCVKENDAFSVESLVDCFGLGAWRVLCGEERYGDSFGIGRRRCRPIRQLR